MVSPAGRRAQDVYARPANLFVARFIGNPPMNTVTGDVTSADGGVGVRIPGQRRRASGALGAAVRSRSLERVVLGVRPEDLTLDEGGRSRRTVSVIESLGHERHVICRLEDGQLIHRPAGRERLPTGRGERDPPRRRRGAPPRVRRGVRGTRRRMSTPVDAVVGSGAGEPPAVGAPRAAGASVEGSRSRARVPTAAPRVPDLRRLHLLSVLSHFYLGFFSTPPFPGQPKHYVGLDQYKDVLTSSEFLDSLKVT